MIKFFRKIRQQLLTENKFSKYLLYAIGEIVLVVIGILIALQLNTQKEENHLAEQETAYYRTIGRTYRPSLSTLVILKKDKML